MPAVTNGRLVAAECDCHRVVAAASSAMVANVEIVKPFMNPSIAVATGASSALAARFNHASIT
jgi:hypothetical protein